MKFEWDDIKAATNLQKHGIGFEEAATVFYDAFALTDFSDRHDGNEERERTIGTSANSRILMVVTTERTPDLRIISARRATRKEIDRYAKAIQETLRGD